MEKMNMESTYIINVEAMDFFKTNKGTIITYNQTDSYIQDGVKIDVIPSWKYII